MAASAIISNTLLTSLHRADKSLDIIFTENKPHIIKNPITYQGTFIFLFLTSSTSSTAISLFVLFFKCPKTNTTTTKPDSPFQFDLNADRLRSYIIGVARLKNIDNKFHGRRCSLK